MGKVTVILTALCLMVCGVSLNNTEATTTRDITGGSVFSSGLAVDTFYNFLGNGFSVRGADLSNVYFGGSTWFLLITNDLNFPPTQLTVDGDTCMPKFGLGETACTGTLHFAIDPAPGFMGTALFTATGHINVGDGFDIVGHGSLTVVSTQPQFVFPNSTFTFIAPEPSTLWLLSVGALLVAVAFRRQRGNEVRSHGRSRLSHL